MQQSLFRQMLRPFRYARGGFGGHPRVPSWTAICVQPLWSFFYNLYLLQLAPYCLETGRDEPNTNFSMMRANLLSTTTSRSEIYLRRATPVGAPATTSNLHLVGRYVGETWLILYQAAYFTFTQGDAFSEIGTAFKFPLEVSRTGGRPTYTQSSKYN